jgi:hypothetical protein
MAPGLLVMYYYAKSLYLKLASIIEGCIGLFRTELGIIHLLSMKFLVHIIAVPDEDP